MTNFGHPLFWSGFGPEEDQKWKLGHPTVSGRPRLLSNSCPHRVQNTCVPAFRLSNIAAVRSFCALWNAYFFKYIDLYITLVYSIQIVYTLAKQIQCGLGEYWQLVCSTLCHVGVGEAA